LDRVPDHRGDVGAAEALDLADAGGGGDVDLGEVVADDVDADKDHVELLEARADGCADLALARGQLAELGPAAHMQVGAGLAFGGNTVDGTDRLAIHDDDALVALADFGEIALHHEGFAEGLLEQLEQRGEVVAALFDEEHAGPAIAVERLDDDVAVLLAER